MVTLEGQKLIFDLSEVEAKIAERTLPVLSPQVEMMVKIVIRIVFHVALLGKEKWREIQQRLDEGGNPDVLIQEFVESIGGREMLTRILEDIKFPSTEEIDRIFDWE